MTSFTTGCARALTALLLFCESGCLCNDESERAPALKPGRPLVGQPQEERRNVVVNGTARNYLLRLPRNYDKAVPAPLMVMFTEEGATTSAFEGRSDILAGAAKLGYVLAVPEPQGNGWKHDVCKTADAGAPAVAAAAKSTKPASARVASAAAKKQDAAAETPDAAAASDSGENQDVAFVRALIDDVAQRYATDAHRVYLLGTDAGAALAARAARTLSTKVAAVALNTSQSVCPSAHWELPAAETAVPAFVVQPASAGAPDAAAPDHPPDPLGAWLEANECTPPGDAAGSRVEYDCKRAPVVRVQSDSGKRWPRKLGSLYTLRVMHNFFSDQTR